MLGNYDPSEALVILDEGQQFTNNPKDAGGPTKLGVTLIALSDFLGRQATIDEVKALTAETVKPIYKAKYWVAVRGDEVPAGIDYFLFDSAVQHGRGRAVKFLQEALRLNDVDGVFGKGTMGALQAANDNVALVENMRAIRQRFYRQIPSFTTFGTGWTKRLNRVALTSSNWARKAA